MPAAKERSAKEVELSEKKLAKEIEKLTFETAYSKLELAEAERDERDALAHSSEARIFNFVNSVGGDSARKCVDTLNEWSRKSKDPITIVFNSPGGNVWSGLAIYDAVMALKDEGIKFTTVVRGMAASMAGVLLQAGDERVIGKNAYILIHEVSDIAAGTTSELEDELKLTKRLQARLLKILAERSTLSEKEIEKKWKKNDWWLDADESVELGFADKIG